MCSGEIVHRRYMYGSIALLPFSVILGVLPLPNVVLAWNLFRAYSHWRALQGSSRLNYVVTDSSLVSSGRTHDTREGAQSPDFREHWAFLPSEKLDSLLVPSDVPRKPITDTAVAEICSEYPLDPLEISL